MGNRLMYGNYVEGYDLVDENANPVMFEYTTALITEEIGTTEIMEATISGNYNINSAQTIDDSVVQINLDGGTIGVRRIVVARYHIHPRYIHRQYAIS